MSTSRPRKFPSLEPAPRRPGLRDAGSGPGGLSRRASARPGRDPRRAAPRATPADPARPLPAHDAGRARWSVQRLGPLGQLLLLDPGRPGRGARGSPLPDRRRVARSSTATVRRGLGPNVDVGLRVPAPGARRGHSRRLHRLVAPAGQRARRRPSALPEGRLPRRGGDDGPGGPSPGTTDTGLGLGDLELEARWLARRRGARSRLPWPLVGRVSLPTGTGPFEGERPRRRADSSSSASPSAGSFDLYAGAGLHGAGPGPRPRHRVRPRSGPTASSPSSGGPRDGCSLVAETNAASRLVENIDRYPGAPLDRERDGPDRPRRAVAPRRGLHREHQEPAHHDRLRPLRRRRPPALTPRAGYNPRP